MKQPIFVESDLDDAGLDPYEFRLLARIYRRWSETEGCYESVPTMAEACRMNIKTAQRALAALQRRRMVKRTPRPGRTDRFDPLPKAHWIADPGEPEAVEKRISTPKSGGTPNQGAPKSGGGVPPNQEVPVPPNQGDKGTPIEGTPNKGSNYTVRPPDGDRPGAGSIDQPRPSESRDPPSRYPKTDWNYRAAAAMLDRLDSLKALSGVVRKALKRKGREEVLQEWADTFRLLQEQDGWSQEQITETMKWLLQRDNKWIQNRWIQSAVTLRVRTQGGDKTRFEAIYNQAKADGNGKHKRTDESPDEAFQRLLRATSSAFAPG